MYQPGFYKTMDRQMITGDVRREGFDPIYISDPPGHVYPPHHHAETKLLVFLRGSMKVRVAGEEFNCQIGDKLVIPGNVQHAAWVGPEGCDFFWSERMPS
jgi:quercetin dioxygenase-like cupin family protein